MKFLHLFMKMEKERKKIKDRIQRGLSKWLGGGEQPGLAAVKRWPQEQHGGRQHSLRNKRARRTKNFIA